MRKILFAAAYFVATVLSVSCGKDVKPSAIPVEIKDDKVYLEDVSDSTHFVLLEETSVESLAGSIFSAQIDDDKLFIAHNPGGGREADQILSVYDLDGHFLNRIGRKGRSRNEFIIVKSWCLDIDRKEVLIFDGYSHAIKRYDYDGKYISQITMPDLMNLNDIIMADGNIYGLTLLPHDVADDLLIINNDGTFNALLDKREMHSQDNLMYAPLSKKHSSDMTSLYHMRTFDNILYKVTGTTVEKCGYFDFLNPPSASRLLNLSTYDMDLLMINPSLGPQTSDYLFLSAWVDKQFTQFIYNKNTGICTRYDSHGTGWGYTPIPIGASGNILITKITPSEAQFALERRIRESDRPMLQAIASQENDALLLYYLKDTD